MANAAGGPCCAWNEIETDPVKYVRALRHLLSHQRGELRTEEQRFHYVAEADEEDWLVGDVYVGGDVPLSHDRVLAMMDDLGSVVRACDATVWRHAWGRGGFPTTLLPLVEGKAAPFVW